MKIKKFTKILLKIIKTAVRYTVEVNMETINDRLKVLRKHLNKTLAEFGRPLGYHNATVSQIERAHPPYDKKVDSRYIKAVCNVYGVREEWLRTGEGSMYADPPETDPEEARVRWALSLFRQLCPEDLERIVAIAEEIVRVGKKKNAEAGPADAAGEVRRRKSA
ncbi:MAG: helix-turn-helix transcriptional regulator [Thermoguttaceae bacterium]|nr:helix-turn-helix transcriptional regulator [Thermoguttaceae bacterium]